MSRHRIVVMASGSGSTFQAIVENCKAAEVVALLCDHPLRKVVDRARNLGIEKVAFDPLALNKKEMEESFADHIESFNPELIVLAGYMRILSPEFVRQFHRIVNIHPSLLPKYKGLHTYQRAIDDGERTHGTTVHQVTEELDDGPILAQQSVNIHPGDTVDTLRERTQGVERVLYPKIIDQIVTGQMAWVRTWN